MSATAETSYALEALIESIKAKCSLVAQMEADALEAAIALGHDFLAAKKLVAGSFKDWIAVNLDISSVTAYKHMRLAFYEDEILAAGATTGAQAHEVICGLPRLSGGPGTKVPLDDEILASVENGDLTQPDAAALLGVSQATVSRVIRYRRPGGAAEQRARDRKRQARDRAARAALRREEQERVIRRKGGGHAELYSLIRRAVQLADNLIGEVSNKEAKAHFASCTRRLHAAEDECVRASKLS